MSLLLQEIEKRKFVAWVVGQYAKELARKKTKRIRVGFFHREIASRLHVASSRQLKTWTNEALSELGYRRTVIHGYPYLTISENKCKKSSLFVE